MSLPLCQILAFQLTRYLLYLVNLVKLWPLVSILFELEIHPYDDSLKHQLKIPGHFQNCFPVSL